MRSFGITRAHRRPIQSNACRRVDGVHCRAGGPLACTRGSAEANALQSRDCQGAVLATPIEVSTHPMQPGTELTPEDAAGKAGRPDPLPGQGMLALSSALIMSIWRHFWPAGPPRG